MKLAKELIRLMSDYYTVNNLKNRMKFPMNEEYLDILKPEVIRTYLSPLGYTILPVPLSSEELKQPIMSRRKIPTFEEQLKEVPKDLLTRVDLVIKGSIFLYLNEILSWNEVKKLLNIGSSDVILYKIEPTDPFGAYDIIISLLSVLFGKISYTTVTPITYPFVRFANDVYYWDQPMYYYGYKLALSYRNINDILDNIDWFIEENPEVQIDGLPDRYDILGMLRINNKFTKIVVEENNLTSQTINTEMEDIGLYNVSLNLIKVDDVWGLNNTLFDFYKGTKETTNYTEDDVTFTEISWSTVRTYSKYVDTVMKLDDDKLKTEKIGNIIRNIQNFLIH